VAVTATAVVLGVLAFMADAADGAAGQIINHLRGRQSDIRSSMKVQ
jgi:hypothetical protein